MTDSTKDGMKIGPIVSQYPGVCGSCGAPYPVGASILPLGLGRGYAHFRCPEPEEGA